jgi:hypothetical protein
MDAMPPFRCPKAQMSVARQKKSINYADAFNISIFPIQYVPMAIPQLSTLNFTVHFRFTFIFIPPFFSPNSTSGFFQIQNGWSWSYNPVTIFFGQFRLS